MRCPHCQLAGVPPGAICPRCRQRSAPTAGGDRGRGSSHGALLAPLLFLLVVGAAYVAYQRWFLDAASHAPASASPRVQQAAPSPAPGVRSGEPSAVTPVPFSSARSGIPAPDSPQGDDVARADRERLDEIATRLQAGQPVLPGDLEETLRILARHPQVEGLPEMTEALALLWVRELAKSRRTSEAIQVANEAARRRPGSVAPHLAILGIRLELGEWREAETVARRALDLDPRSTQALEGLGVALFRLDRDREAEEVLDRAVAQGGSQNAQQILDLIKRGKVDEKGMLATQWAHFSVRFDGDVHRGVAREVLTALDRHYTELTVVFRHEARAPIPVILFDRAGYQRATQAPAWSGGVYTHIDGRIRIPVGREQGSVDPDLDRTLMHELTHAFVTEMSAGLAPRALHEGLAQYMEGHRIESLLDETRLAALADGRMGGVGGFYLSSLVFAEMLIDLRGQSGINDVLAAMASEGNVDAACQRVYGRDFAELQAEAARRLQQRHGR